MSNAMRALKIVTIVMGVLILAGTAVMIAAIIKRGGPSPPDAPFAVHLDEPAGTTIVAISSARDRLIVQLRGGGVDRVLLIDPASGMVVGRVSLDR